MVPQVIGRLEGAEHRGVIDDWRWVLGPAISGTIDGEPVTTSQVVARGYHPETHRMCVVTVTGGVYDLGEERRV